MMRRTADPEPCNRGALLQCARTMFILEQHFWLDAPTAAVPERHLFLPAVARPGDVANESEGLLVPIIHEPLFLSSPAPRCLDHAPE